MDKQPIILRNTEQYPCQWIDIIDEDSRVTYVTVYTLKNAKRDLLRPIQSPGITLGEDGVYDIVVDVNRLTAAVVRNSLNDLTKITGIEYILLDDDLLYPHF